MKSLRPWLVLPLTCVLSLGATVSGRGAEQAPLKLMIHPVAAARPALGRQLLPPFLDRIDGNAAVYYGKVTAEQAAFFGNRELADKIEKWRVAPLAELRKDDVKLDLGNIDYYLTRAARCDRCDWQLPLRDEPFFQILLPELAQMRQFARVFAAKARIQIARGEYDEAVKTLQSGFAMSRHAAAGETLINGLVGIAIADLMCDQMTEFVQQRDAPNLYWALTSLPQPLIEMRLGLEAEMAAVVLTFRDLRGAHEAQYSPEEWRQILFRFWSRLLELGDRRESVLSGPEALVAVSLRGYPIAKAGLIEKGMSRDQVEKMPVAQVITIYTLRTYEELRDDIFKWYHVPYCDSIAGMAAAERQLGDASLQRREVLPLASLVLPAVGSVRTSLVRMDRRMAVLRVVEALRLHGASHGGKLPAALSEITEVPVPRDPATDQPFQYRLEGNTAHLQGPVLRREALNVEISMVRE